MNSLGLPPVGERGAHQSESVGKGHRVILVLALIIFSFKDFLRRESLIKYSITLVEFSKISKIVLNSKTRGGKFLLKA